MAWWCQSKPKKYSFPKLLLVVVLTQHQELCQNNEFTTVSHQVFMEIQKLVSDFFRAGAFTFIILKIEKHVNLEEKDNKKGTTSRIENLNSGALKNYISNVHKLHPPISENPLSIIQSNQHQKIKSILPDCSGWKQL